MQRLCISLALCFLVSLAPDASAQSQKQLVIIEYGPAPTYRVIGLHRLVKDPTGCQIRRYNGRLTNVEKSYFFEKLGPHSFTLRNSRSRQVVITIEDALVSRGISADTLLSFLKEGRILNVRAYQCGEIAAVADSIELSAGR